jgi:hypothetical protein
VTLLALSPVQRAGRIAGFGASAALVALAFVHCPGLLIVSAPALVLGPAIALIVLCHSSGTRRVALFEGPLVIGRRRRAARRSGGSAQP